MQQCWTSACPYVHSIDCKTIFELQNKCYGQYLTQKSFKAKLDIWLKIEDIYVPYPDKNACMQYDDLILIFCL